MVISVKEIGMRILAAITGIVIVAGILHCILARNSEKAAMGPYVPPLTLIIDAGHGGADGGATSISGVLESDINLEIVLKIEAFANLFGIQVALTRLSADIAYPDGADTIRDKKVADTKNRVELVTSAENPVFISIHQNTYASSDVRGFVVLYANTPESGDFAAAVQSALVTGLNPASVRTPALVPSNVYIMNHISCPAILIECGFLSNPEEERLLLSDPYQVKIAASVFAAFIEHTDTFEEYYAGGSDEEI